MRLIDADALKKAFKKSPFVNEVHLYYARQLIRLAPTIEERPRGEWIYNQYCGNPDVGNWHCSECRHIVYVGYGHKLEFKFCPNCGADMRKEGGEKC